VSATPDKKPKKERKQTEAERLAALRYNHMLYGPTAGELRPVAKTTYDGSAYLKHPKFQSLIAAFKKGTEFKFDVTDKDRVFTISTAESNLAFDGKIMFYSRPLNRHEHSLLLDKQAAIPYQRRESFVHFVFAVLKSLPELEAPPLAYRRPEFLLGSESMEDTVATQGPNLLLGAYTHSHPQERPKK
jgi:hypothetical protein